MGWIKNKTAAAADNAAVAVMVAGLKVGGEKGGKVANKITSTVLGREYVPCGDPNCNGECKDA
ncbi:hypothetical protein [Streptomyces sp. MJP52]|uniref:hypothetical protein n=1 Tax=Streptomyces sp. MJP52 TaxID=2940555 RepID=UPI002475ABEE|nr:hypothetical protein [Streptomyces sp. MJP52]MDH6224337.1 hypothetical protein [Streptomyces sp. MJP52]